MIIILVNGTELLSKPFVYSKAVNKMIVTRENNEIVIRIPDTITDLDGLQDLLDYLVYRSIVTKSTATEEQIDELSREVNSSWWAENKHRFLPE